MRKLGILENLTRVFRYAGNLLIKQESVSDHVWCMNTLAIEYVPKVNSYIQTPELQFNIKDVIYGITLHDIDEALTTDIPRLVKHHNKEIEDAIDNTVKSIMLDKLGSDFYNQFKEIEDKTTPLGVLIKIFDLAQAGFKMKSEYQLGNRYFRSEICNVSDCLNGIYDKLHKLEFEDEIKNALYILIDEFLDEFK